MYKTILLVLVFATTAVVAQNEAHRNFTQGFVVLQSGDTMTGNIAVLSEEESCDRVEFRKYPTDPITTYKPEEAKMYKRENSVYVSRPISDKKVVFMGLIEKGKVNVYQYSNQFKRKGIADGSGNPKEADGPAHIKHTEQATVQQFDYYLEKTGGDLKKISRLNIRGELWTFFKGDDEMVKKVKTEKIEYEAIPALIKAYNGGR